MKIRDIAWLAGLLEGEGSFGMAKGSPLIQIGMSDLDVITRAANLMGAPKPSVYELKGNKLWQPHWKATCRTVLHGARAIGWMFTLYPFLGERRRETIRNVIDGWKKSERRSSWVPKNVEAPAQCHPDRPSRALGLCMACYMKKWHEENGNGHTKKTTRSLNRLSHVATCHPDRPHQAHGLCNSCYQKKYQAKVNTV
jgi:hypothetical protein